MKALRFAWDHPALTAVCIATSALVFVACLMMPWFWIVVAVGALSVRKSLQQGDKMASALTAGIDTAYAAQLAAFKARRAQALAEIAAMERGLREGSSRRPTPASPRDRR